MSDNEPIGYRKPPKAGQFRKGLSGNPAGRPRKLKVDKPVDLPDAAFPTRNMLRHEAQRKYKIRDGSGEREISAREGVLRSLFSNALKGGVLAQRTALDQLNSEDERFNKEQWQRFERWSDYKEKYQPLINKARQSGVERDDILPHPEDVELDEQTLEVRFRGARTQEDRSQVRVVEQVQELAYEMMVFTAEAEHYREQQDGVGHIGLYMAVYLDAHRLLPPRLKRSPAQLTEVISEHIASGNSDWEEGLRARCRALGLPFMKKFLPVLGCNHKTKCIRRLTGDAKPDFSKVIEPG